MLPISTPPPDWMATAAPGASVVVVGAYAPGALSSGDVAIVAVLVFGFLILAALQLLVILKRTV